MPQKLNLVIIPLDDRPVSYQLPAQTAKINSNVNVLMPPRHIIGGLTNDTDITAVSMWLQNAVKQSDIDVIVLSLDTFAYGGLIPSRRTTDTFEDIRKRIDSLIETTSNISKEKKPKIYAFSSIMRISNNNINEEEKLYWSEYGELLYKYSFLSHQLMLGIPIGLEFDEVRSSIPSEILVDYLDTRRRNFEINKYYIELAQENLFDYLVFSKDDTGQYGLNVQEALHLRQIVESNDLNDKVCIQTGADEIPTDLVARALVDYYKASFSFMPVYATEDGPNLISRYEDRTISESVKQQIGLCGGQITASRELADALFYVYTPSSEQNDHAMKIYKDSVPVESLQNMVDLIHSEEKPFAVCDVTHANGADNLFTKELFSDDAVWNRIYAYSAWNTTGNALGSCAAMLMMRLLAEKNGTFSKTEFSALLLTRIADDWIYQSIIRQKIRAITNTADIEMLDEEMRKPVENLCHKLDVDCANLKFSFPWQRTFEVEVHL